MRGNRSRDTRPEKKLRSELYRLGLRYRIWQRPLPQLRRTADVVFRSVRIAVFVDGCFWHGCPEHYVPSKSNKDYWDSKVAANRVRDSDTDRRLSEADWWSIRVWEHEEPVAAAARIAKAIRVRRSCT